ncbi:MAG: VOC family protein [Polyangiaceae bacterium]|nr:VOC family protein [Polyangiaceae bacterium]
MPDKQEWEKRCAAMSGAGFVEVQSFNPYWNVNGRTFQDPDGYRIVIQCGTWKNRHVAPLGTPAGA